MIECRFDDGHPARLRHVVMDAVITDGDRVLLVRRAPRLLEGGKWALVGGFLERDETVFDGLRREVMEESGYACREMSVSRIVSDPHRRGDESQNVTFVFDVRVGDRVGEPDDEVTDVRWFPFEQIPPREQFAFDHWEFIQHHLQHRQDPVASLPIM